ncbi:MAG: hypothetical protein AB1716_11845 [Planctomycetota bacterium]
MSTPRKVLLGVFLVAGALSAGAQDVAREQTKLLAKRAAEADAYRKLAEIVYGLQINSQTYVRDFVTESDDIRSAVDSVVKGIRLGQPNWFEDGSCEVPAEVTVAKVIETLRDAHQRHYKGHSIRTSDFETMAQRIEKKVIKVVGSGAPRAELPPDLPAGVAETLGPPPASVGRSAFPPIWSKLPPQARMMAERAALMDAQRKLAERLKGLRLTANTVVRDFVTESDEVRTDLDTFLIGAEEVGKYYHHDELIVEVTLRVPTEQVITTIRTLHSRYSKGDDIKGHDVDEAIKSVVKRDFEVTGMGIPPPRYLKRYNETAEVQLPDWAMTDLEAIGQGTDPEFASPQGRLKAARAAELDAKRKLGEHIAGQRITSETRVDDYVAQREEIVAELDAVLANARVLETKYDDEQKTASVKVSVPGMEIWGIVRDAVQRRNRQ